MLRREGLRVLRGEGLRGLRWWWWWGGGGEWSKGRGGGQGSEGRERQWESCTQA